jgi:predicted P-loop ATPase
MTKSKPRDFRKDENGKIHANDQQNIALALSKLSAKLAYDLLKERPLLNGEPLQDHDLDHLWLTIDREYKFRPEREFFKTVALSLARQNAFHPVVDYLDGLEWDGKTRLDTWLVEHMGADDTPFVRAVGSITLIAAVRRVRRPGCKFDELLTLASPQGDGKSSALRNLCHDPAWFTDNLPLTGSSKVVIEQTAGFWIAEIADLQGFKQVDWDRLKANLSRQEDVARLAYGRLSTYRPRQFVAIGTTNGEDYLTDPTGNRRFWPVRLNAGSIDQEAIKRARDQLWAEAAVREAAGGSIRLPQELWAVAAEEQDGWMRDSVVYQILSQSLDGIEEGRIPTEALWAILEETIGKRRDDKMRGQMQGAMRRLGWRRGADKGRIEASGKRAQGYLKGERPRGIPLPLWTVSPASPGELSQANDITAVMPGVKLDASE